MKRIVLILSMVVVLSAGGYASDLVGAMPELNMGVGARGLGMGGAYVAMANDQTAAYWNPAGLAKIMKREFVAALSADMDVDRSLHYVGYAQKVEGGIGVSLSIIRAEMKDIMMVDANKNKKGMETYTSTAILLSGSKKVENLNIGASLKVLQQDIVGEVKDDGFGFDAGIAYEVDADLTFGSVLRNIGSKIGDGKVDLLLQSGVGYSVSKNLGVEFDFVRNFERKDSYVRAGAEYNILDRRFCIRAGVDDGELAFGLSFALDKKDKAYEVGVDYAFVGSKADIYDDSHRIQIGVKF